MHNDEKMSHEYTCPVGIATQDEQLRKNFKGKPEHVINFFYFVANELREIMALLGFKTMDEMIGQTQKINTSKAINHYKAKGLDFSSILYQPFDPKTTTLRNTENQDHNLYNVLDVKDRKISTKSNSLWNRNKLILQN